MIGRKIFLDSVTLPGYRSDRFAELRHARPAHLSHHQTSWSFAMAKRIRASARTSKTRKLPSTKVRQSNAERTRKAVEARRVKFSPELDARGRDLFQEARAALADIGFELGIHKATVPAVAKRRNWKRYVPPL